MILEIKYFLPFCNQCLFENDHDYLTFQIDYNFNAINDCLKSDDENTLSSNFILFN